MRTMPEVTFSLYKCMNSPREGSSIFHQQITTLVYSSPAGLIYSSLDSNSSGRVRNSDQLRYTPPPLKPSVTNTRSMLNNVSPMMVISSAISLISDLIAANPICNSHNVIAASQA